MFLLSPLFAEITIPNWRQRVRLCPVKQWHHCFTPSTFHSSLVYLWISENLGTGSQDRMTLDDFLKHCFSLFPYTKDARSSVRPSKCIGKQQISTDIFAKELLQNSNIVHSWFPFVWPKVEISVVYILVVAYRSSMRRSVSSPTSVVEQEMHIVTVVLTRSTSASPSACMTWQPAAYLTYLVDTGNV